MIAGNVKSTAILIHQSTDTGAVDVTSHPVLKTSRGFTLGAGGAFDESEKSMLVGVLTGAKEMSPQIYPEGLLFQGDEALVWHVKARKAEISFRLDREVSTFTAPIPAHVFAYIRGVFFAFSVKGNAYPTKNTPLYYSPTGNVHEDGHVCTGNVSLPRKYSLDTIPDLECFFYEAAGTDIENFAVVKEADSYEELITFWRDLSASSARSFPARQFIPTHSTLGALIDRISKQELEN